MDETSTTPPSLRDFAIAVAFALPFLMPMAWIPAGRGASAMLLAGETLLNGASPYDPPWFFHDPGAALIAAIVRFFAPADLGAWSAIWALWQCATAASLALLARRIAGPFAAAAAALIYGASLAAFGFEALGRPETLAAWPLAAALSNLFREGRKPQFGVGLALGVASLFCLAAAGAMLAVVVYHFVKKRDGGVAVRWGGYELLGLLIPWLAAAAIGVAGGWWGSYVSTRLFVWPLMLPGSLAGRLSGVGLVPVSGVMAFGLVAALVIARSRRAAAPYALAAAVAALWVFSAMRSVISPGAELLALGPASLCAGLAIQAVVRFVRSRGGASRWWAVAVIAGALSASPIPEAVRQLRFVPEYLQGVDEVRYQGRFFDARTGFDSAVVLDLAHWLTSNAAPDDEVLVYGNEPGLNLWSRRRPACGFGSILPAVAERIGADAGLDACLRLQSPAVIVMQRDWRNWSAGTGLRSRVKTAPQSAVRDALARDYRHAQKLMGFDLYVRADRRPKAAPLATIFELNTRPAPQPSSSEN